MSPASQAYNVEHILLIPAGAASSLLHSLTWICFLTMDLNWYFYIYFHLHFCIKYIFPKSPNKPPNKKVHNTTTISWSSNGHSTCRMRQYPREALLISSFTMQNQFKTAKHSLFKSRTYSQIKPLVRIQLSCLYYRQHIWLLATFQCFCTQFPATI